MQVTASPGREGLATVPIKQEATFVPQGTGVPPSHVYSRVASPLSKLKLLPSAQAASVASVPPLSEGLSHLPDPLTVHPNKHPFPHEAHTMASATLPPTAVPPNPVAHLLTFAGSPTAHSTTLVRSATVQTVSQFPGFASKE